ncbi:type IV secretion system DNA-binding domain-containing protein [Luteimonas sp. MC1750]|uniref:type IV secretion system DNA-binding domain-containing protein n=1 Tax=Luteimonas sp. MC1750 TaxID=2799326 RepID=UPI0018F0A14F|nr:type IV secretion system DNA-binding domain-containing protein [Luteimonas sp. MC1750]MBJ6984039.1 type IV secretion system DNA-binding domain-containing protein [Luteimonas sp. MC1750]QQO06851.1 type IV secretion system DNA-binding domain-containing protein [Luteimonas sp. MC1750]
MSTKVYDAFGRPGPHIDASIPVRRWDLGLSYAALGFGAVFTPLAAATIGLRNTVRALSLDPAFYSRIDNYTWVHDMGWLGVATACGLLAGASLGYLGLIPRSNSWVVSGPRLLEGKQAIAEARRRGPPQKERKHDLFGMYIHPDLFMSKRLLSQSMLIFGSTGSGKTQILLTMLQQIIANKHAKLFLYDIKGDFSSKFTQCSIVSPFDSRSRIWHVARDVQTTTQASAFANSLIPEDSGSGKFWTEAARQILYGVVISLQNEKPLRWTWTDLASRVSMRAEELAPILDENYRKAHNLIANTEGQTSFNILATLGAHTKIIDDLARAWPDYDDRRANPRLFSITDWVRDDYKGPKKVIVQSGADRALTQAYISALINVAELAINSPQLSENEEGRSLAFVLDELSSVGKINFAPLVDKGRSKGVVFVAGVQDLAQLRDIYGDNTVKAIQGMVGTQIICRVQMGETRDELSRLMGTNKVARMDYGPGAKLHNEGTPVVYPNQLTDMLGPRKIKKEPGFVIRAIVQQGGDLLLLDFPGQPMPDLRKGQVAAEWTKRPAGFEREPVKDKVETTLSGKEMGQSFSAEEIDDLFAR